VYLATEASEKVATRLVSEIAAAFEPVRYFPLAAPTREQLAPGLRVTFHGAYAIYFRPFPDAVMIIRVLHGARDVAALADRGGFAG
jgi:toxin ParE1/3/4